MTLSNALSNFFRSALRSFSRNSSSMVRCFSVIGFGFFRSLGMPEL